MEEQQKYCRTCGFRKSSKLVLLGGGTTNPHKQICQLKEPNCYKNKHSCPGYVERTN